ncbi:unnamed protein product [Strongylus vulgaris]|uniref:Peptidase M12A domain-containing protein n=1 Tax=Strongylus vulgaris TaxID=40348 RepID=A0A3P7KX41_STRVU|nr:unnamed protein product [Strongylus vulgaris]
MQWLGLVALILLPTISFQLGKSDRKAKQEKKEEEKQIQKETETEQSLHLAHPPSSVTKQSILKNHENVDFTERKFENAMLVYVTPVVEFEGLRSCKMGVAQGNSCVTGMASGLLPLL